MSRREPTEQEKIEFLELQNESWRREVLEWQRRQEIVQRYQLALQIQQAIMQRNALRRSNMSWYERFEDAIFDW